MPPPAAATGRAAIRRSRRSPATSSLLISSATTKKNSDINPSFTKCCRSSLMPTVPTFSVTSVCQTDSYDACQGELAHTTATAAAATRTMPLAASVSRNHRTATGRLRPDGAYREIRVERSMSPRLRQEAHCSRPAFPAHRESDDSDSGRVRRRLSDRRSHRLCLSRTSASPWLPRATTRATVWRRRGPGCSTPRCRRR